MPADSKADAKPDDVIANGQYRVFHDKVLGSGAFGVVVKGERVADGERVAVKVELRSIKTPVLVDVEVAALRMLQGSPHVPRLYELATTPYGAYAVMELADDSLNELRHAAGGGGGGGHDVFFDAQTAAALARAALRCIEAVHVARLVHRDIKPSNFLWRKRDRRVLLIDFGLCRAQSPERTGAGIGFRGTPRYASPNAHVPRDLGMRDDLYSWYYMVYEFTLELPWRRLRDKDEIAAHKANRTQLLAPAPPPLAAVYELIEALAFEHTPDFDALVARLNEWGALDAEAAPSQMPADKLAFERPQVSVDAAGLLAVPGSDKGGGGGRHGRSPSSLASSMRAGLASHQLSERPFDRLDAAQMEAELAAAPAPSSRSPCGQRCALL